MGRAVLGAPDRPETGGDCRVSPPLALMPHACPPSPAGPRCPSPGLNRRPPHGSTDYHCAVLKGAANDPLCITCLSNIRGDTISHSLWHCLGKRVSKPHPPESPILFSIVRFRPFAKAPQIQVPALDPVRQTRQFPVLRRRSAAELLVGDGRGPVRCGVSLVLLLLPLVVVGLLAASTEGGVDRDPGAVLCRGNARALIAGGNVVLRSAHRSTEFCPSGTTPTLVLGLLHNA